MAEDKNTNSQKITPGNTVVSMNTFYKGMNKDQAKYALPLDQYYDARNIRIVADHGKESVALVNSEGNEFLVELPCAPTVWEVVQDQTVVLTGIPWTTTISIITTDPNIGSNNYTITLSGTGGNIVQIMYQALEDGTTWFLNGVAQVWVGVPKTEFNWHYDESSKVLTMWGTHDLSGPRTSDYIFNMFGLSVSGGFVNVLPLSAPHCDLEVIGYTTLRDDIYLFTTNIDNGNPFPNPTTPTNPDIGGPGQIWKLSYNFSTYDYILECIYARGNCMNFTKQHPIEAIGRYENADTQSIYWTDFFNPPRKLNTARDSMATPCAFLDLAPKTGFQIPTLDRVSTGGVLEAGIYQMAYRYKNAEGLTTSWSPLSNKVAIYSDDDQNAYCAIEGSPYDMDTGTGTVTSKRIRWALNGLDISYELIEFVAIYRVDDIRANAEVYIFQEILNATTNLMVDLTGSENKIQTTLTDILSGIGATFEKVKTLESKDNKLFFGNIVNTSFFVEYEARAYRFDNTQVSILDSVSDVAITLDGTNLLNPPNPADTPIDQVPDIHDCINSFNDENPATNANWYINDQYQFQADGVTLGGTGLNVSYRFIREQMKEDDNVDQAGDYDAHGNDNVFNHAWSENCAGYNPPPLRACFVDPVTFNPNIINLGIANQQYPLQNSYDSFKSTYKFSLYEGYARGETYRFGLIFYNNKGEASFVRWIGDIKIPFSYSNGANGQGLGFFAVHNWQPIPGGQNFTFWGNTYNVQGNLFTNSIGLEFTVNLDPATSGIDVNALGITGYSIVRCERKQTDKSRFGTGLINQVDRLEINQSDWDGMPADIPNLWGTPAGESVLIPTTCATVSNETLNLPIPVSCLGWSLGYIDCIGEFSPVQHPWDPNWIAPSLFPGTRVHKTRNREIMIYGPLGWHNSSVANTGNVEEGLMIDQVFAPGDYLKYESVYWPHVNTNMNSPRMSYNYSLPPPQTIAWAASEHWYKYYMPITQLSPGIPGANPWTGDWVNGILGNAFAQDPANNKIALDWAGWVDDGGRIQSSADSSLLFDFLNVTNPTMGIDKLEVLGTTHEDAARVHSIGSEGLVCTLTNQLNFNELLMGANISGNQNAYWNPMPSRATLSYERYNTPYGGPTRQARANSTYIFCGHFQPLDSTTNLVNLATTWQGVFGGDVTTQVFDFTQYEKNWGQTQFWNYDTIIAYNSNYQSLWGNQVMDDDRYGWMRACMVPLEVHVPNPQWRHGYHFANKGGVGGAYPSDGTNLHDEYRLNKAYGAENDIRVFSSIPFNFSLNEEFDTRIYYSQTKVNGEVADSWSTFLVGDYKDVEGIYGPINKLTLLHDTMYYFQDKGFGALSINPTAVVQDSAGNSLQLGTVAAGLGNFIQDWTYISTQYGSKQQWAITQSDTSLYFFDILQRKLFNYTAEGTVPLSDVTGLHSYFLDHLTGDILNYDNPILGVGVNCTVDNKHNEALFSFHDTNASVQYRLNIVAIVGIASNLLSIIVRDVEGCNPCANFKCGAYNAFTPDPRVIWDNIYINGKGPYAGWGILKMGCSTATWPNAQPGDIVIWIPWNGTNFTPDLVPAPVAGDYIDIDCAAGLNNFTIAFNELTRGFTTFYDFNPSIYVNDGKSIITPNTETSCINPDDEFYKNRLYIHDIGNYGQYYDIIFPSTVTLIANAQSPSTKVFDNISFHMESLLVDNLPQVQDIDIVNDVFDKVRFYTDYQISGYVNLIPGTNIRKKEREWQMHVPRNILDENLVDADIFNAANYDISRTWKDRMRDKYMLVDLIYNNYHAISGEAKNVKFILHYFKTFFRASLR